ncbi:MAG: YidE/YbjL duplication [candidate division Zixibacteria bacterium]|nr:YidE/YbjL duplication [candidate division Zixibacteria bacterium]
MQNRRVLLKSFILLLILISVCIFFNSLVYADPTTRIEDSVTTQNSSNIITENSTNDSGRSTIRILLDIPLIALFAIIGVGLLLGRINIYGVSFGSSGVMFSALSFGAIGCTIPDGIGTLGLVLFIYCIGISAGSSFFRSFVRQGANLAKLGVILAGTGAITAYLFGYFTNIPTDLAVGIFAGAMTSTPSLAAAMDTLQSSSAVSVGYGIAYPFGVIGVVMFVQLFPRLLKINLDEESEKIRSAEPIKKEIRRILVEIQNSSVVGKRISEIQFIEDSRCQIPRILIGERLIPVTPETTLQKGQHLLIVGKEHRLQHIIDFLGKCSDKTFFIDTESEHAQIVVTSHEVAGKKLKDLKLLIKFGVTVSRIIRNDVSFVPQATTMIRNADLLTIVGEPDNLKKFAAFAGHRARLLDHTDLVSLSVGIIAGVIVGMIPIALPGSRGFSLGMAGGPLLVALILAHYGNIGGIRGHIPRASRLLMMELGLVFFLADAGVKAGGKLIEILLQYGVTLLSMGVVVTIVPMLLCALFAKYYLKLNILQIIGGTCGGMTSTPGLGVISEKTDSDIPLISYATAYPVALIMMTVFTQLLVSLLN